MSGYSASEYSASGQGIYAQEWEDRRAALIAEHGQPVYMPEADALRQLGGAGAGLNRDEVVAYRYASREAAEAWHWLNHEHHGHASLGIVADAEQPGCFIGVLDVRRQLAAMRQHFAEQHPAQR